MDADRFDTLTRTLTEARSRRGTLASLLGGTLGLLGLADATAKNCKKIENKKKRKACVKKAKNKKKQDCGDLIPCGDQCCSALETCCGNHCCDSGRDICCGTGCCFRGDTCCGDGNCCDPSTETCVGGFCFHHCFDEQENLGETDTDCGGTCRDLQGGTCIFRQKCAEDADCQSTVCVNRPDFGGKTCQECRDDADCARNIVGLPRCVDNRCFECRSDTEAVDCPQVQVCDETNTCVPRQPCEGDSECGGGFCLDCCEGCGDGSHCFASEVCP
jgi:hypothetical protein